MWGSGEGFGLEVGRVGSNPPLATAAYQLTLGQSFLLGPTYLTRQLERGSVMSGALNSCTKVGYKTSK